MFVAQIPGPETETRLSIFTDFGLLLLYSTLCVLFEKVILRLRNDMIALGLSICHEGWIMHRLSLRLWLSSEWTNIVVFTRRSMHLIIFITYSTLTMRSYLIPSHRSQRPIASIRVLNGSLFSLLLTRKQSAMVLPCFNAVVGHLLELRMASSISIIIWNCLMIHTFLWIYIKFCLIKLCHFIWHIPYNNLLLFQIKVLK